VVSRPEHIKMWWSDDASFEPVTGAVGELVWGERGWDMFLPRLQSYAPSAVVHASGATK